MKKDRDSIIGNIIVGGALLFFSVWGISTYVGNSQQNSNINSDTKVDTSEILKNISNSEDVKEAIEIPTPVCDGTTITLDCEFEGVVYSKFIYHAAVAEISHIETITTYEKEVYGYCTLCNDGTYSPSCATGRGACSWHGGVAQWNAPRYRTVPVYTEKKVIDAPAKDAYYEKVAQ